METTSQRITTGQQQFIASLLKSKIAHGALKVLQVYYDADERNTDGWKVTSSGAVKHVVRHLSREQASVLIDDLKAL